MINIEKQAWDAMVEHAEKTFPNECCGAMLGVTTPGKIDGDIKTVTQGGRHRELVSTGAQGARYELRPEDLLKEPTAKRVQQVTST